MPMPNAKKWYYANANDEPVGPLSTADLLKLRAAGIVQDQTLVIERGGSEWRPLATITTPTPPVPPRSARPLVAASTSNKTTTTAEPKAFRPKTARATAKHIACAIAAVIILFGGYYWVKNCANRPSASEIRAQITKSLPPQFELKGVEYRTEEGTSTYSNRPACGVRFTAKVMAKEALFAPTASNQLASRSAELQSRYGTLLQEVRGNIGLTTLFQKEFSDDLNRAEMALAKLRDRKAIALEVVTSEKAVKSVMGEVRAELQYGAWEFNQSFACNPPLDTFGMPKSEIADSGVLVEGTQEADALIKDADNILNRLEATRAREVAWLKHYSTSLKAALNVGLSYGGSGWEISVIERESVPGGLESTKKGGGFPEPSVCAGILDAVFNAEHVYYEGWFWRNSGTFGPVLLIPFSKDALFTYSDKRLYALPDGTILLNSGTEAIRLSPTPTAAIVGSALSVHATAGTEVARPPIPLAGSESTSLAMPPSPALATPSPRPPVTLPVQTPPPPVIPSASTAPSGPTANLEPMLTSFLQEHHAKSSRGDIAGLVADYGDRVDHFTHGMVDREYIRKDELAYHSPGTRVTEALTNQPAFSQLSGILYRAVYTIGFQRIQADGRSITGSSDIEMLIELTPNGPRIVYQRARNRDQKKGRLSEQRLNPAPVVNTPMTNPAARNSMGSSVITGIPVTEFLNVHSRPAMDSATVFRLSNGQAVQLIGVAVFNGKTEWLPIRAQAGEGWVSRKYLLQSQ